MEESSCHPRLRPSAPSAICGRGSAPAPRPASSCTKRSSTCAAANTARARPGRRSQSACRRRVVPVCRCRRRRKGGSRRARAGRRSAIMRWGRGGGSRERPRRGAAVRPSARSSAKVTARRPEVLSRHTPSAPPRPGGTGEQARGHQLASGSRAEAYSRASASRGSVRSPRRARQLPVATTAAAQLGFCGGFCDPEAPL